MTSVYHKATKRRSAQKIILSHLAFLSMDFMDPASSYRQRVTENLKIMEDSFSYLFIIFTVVGQTSILRCITGMSSSDVTGPFDL